WAPALAAAVPGASSTYLQGVSCPVAGTCIAVGYSLRPVDGGTSEMFPVAQRLGGSSAQTMVVTSPNGAQGASLTSVSCTSPTYCVAVGYFLSSGVERPLAEVMAAGSWNAVAVPAASTGNNVLSSVSCTAAVAPSCTAVGHYRGPSGEHVLVADLAAGANAFVLRSGAEQKGPQNALGSVACSTGGFCVAVGFYNNGHADQTLVEMRSEGVWTLVASPDRSVANNVLDAVSCSSPSSCQAVGFYSNGNGRRALADVFEGGMWKTEQVPNAGSKGAVMSDNELSGLACITGSPCEAVGSYQLGGRPQLLAEAFSASGWAVLGAGGYQSAQASLEATACPAPGQCVSVGYQLSVTGVEQPLVEVQTGPSWSVVAANLLPRSALALVHGSPSGHLDGVSCWASSQCVAVGSFVGAAGNDQPLIATDVNGSWSATAGPGPGLAAEAAMYSVSCPAPGACVAVGEYRNTAGLTLPMVEAQQQGTWTLSYVPGQGAASNDLRSVSCPEAGICTAVGDYSSKAGPSHTLVEQLENGYWSVVASPDGSPSATASVLGGVYCTGAGTCIAVGYSTSAGGTTALVLDGTAAGWQVAAAPGVAGARLQSVSCAGGRSCVAVGYFAAQGAQSALVAVTSAGGWLVAPSPSPGQSSELVSVSCATADRSCAASGSYSDGESQSPLVETGASAPAAPQRTRTSVTAPTGQVLPGQSVTFTATVEPTPVGGTVDFLDNGASLPECKSAPVSSNGEATCVVAWSAVGAQLVQAVFSGSSGFNPSSSVIFDLVVKPRPAGYWLVTRDGQVFATGAASTLGDAPAGTKSVVAMAAAPDGAGYWLVTAHGAVYAFGTAHAFGDLPQLGVHADDIVALAATPDGEGYWLVGRDGGFFAFGDARFEGSLPGRHVHVHDIVGLQPQGSAGYLLVGADGGVFRFGSAVFHGSLPARHVHVRDIRSMVLSTDGRGYTLVGADGGVFTFGKGAPFYGSLPGRHVKASDIVGLALSPDGRGYLMARANGQVFAFGDARAESVPAALAGHLPVVSITAV
ncbi:MAG TPA: Ig-like domain-containing protein, partial [Acidimicrobiales bacterium]|nr:Ig-like domain-containing protein [Acidimicrobiales bacterium]